MGRIRELDDLENESGEIAGRWRLDDQHRLFYRAKGKSERMEVEASLVAAEPDALVVSMMQKKENGNVVTSLARLEGKWRANDRNEIEFEAAYQSGKSSLLQFGAAWSLNDSHELIYTRRKKFLKTKTLERQTLVFKGSWALSEKNYLAYTLEGADDASFRFRGAFQTKNIQGSRSALKFQLGADIKGGKPRARDPISKTAFRSITFFGKWKVAEDLSLEFSLECADGKKRTLRFGAEFRLTQDLTVAAHLLSWRGEPLGIEVVFNREILDGKAEVFVRLRKMLGESAAEAGITIPW